MALILALAVFLVSSVIWAEETPSNYSLKYRLNSGEHYKVQLTVDTLTTQLIQGQKIQQNAHIGIEYLFEIINVDDEKGIGISSTHNSVQALYQTPFCKTSFDSNLKTKECPSELLAHKWFAEKPSLMNVSSIGEMTVDDSITGGTGDIPDISRMTEDEKVAALMNAFLKLKSAKGIYIYNIAGNIFPRYAREAVAPGTVWSDTTQLTNGDQLIVGPGKYRLLKVEDQIAYIEVNGDLKLDTQDSLGFDSIKCENAIKANGSVLGQCQAEAQSGWPLRGDYTIKLSGTLRRMEKEIPIQVEMHIHFETTEIKPAIKETDNSVREGGQSS